MEAPSLDKLCIRDMTLADSARVVALNDSVVHVTSVMDTTRFSELFGLSNLKLVAELHGEVAAFAMAMSEGKPYENNNYRWFSERLQSFLYIDRIVVSDACRGHGIGSQFYLRMFDAARQTGVLNVCAEMDLEPPNAASLRFHEKSGFVEIGTRTLESGKIVSMQVCSLSRSSVNETRWDGRSLP